MLGDQSPYRLDLVRGLAGLHPKVFDKTILDMARLGDIDLFSEDISGLNDAQKEGMFRKGDHVFVRFSFVEKKVEPRPYSIVSNVLRMK